MTKVYLDANVVIYYVEQHPLFFPQLKVLLLDPAKQIKVAFSDLVRMETRLLPVRLGDHALLARYDQFFQALHTPPLPMTGPVFDLATQLRARYRLKTPDALHLAAAIYAECDEFWTHDQRLAAAAQNRLQVITFGSNP
ncbi:MAG: hypothetical protein RLZZ352_1892 [Pseudomonadota bacterium]|jgi:predicted nucleic acid-binding protein